MKRWPVKAEVCLEAGKRASRGKTKRANGRKTGRKGRKKRLRDDIELESEVFPQPLQSCRKCNKKRRALAPEGCISLISPQNRSFFAACLAPERCSPSISPEIPSFSAACKARTLHLKPSYWIASQTTNPATQNEPRGRRLRRAISLRGGLLCST